MDKIAIGMQVRKFMLRVPRIVCFVRWLVVFYPAQGDVKDQLSTPLKREVEVLPAHAPVICGLQSVNRCMARSPTGRAGLPERRMQLRAAGRVERSAESGQPGQPERSVSSGRRRRGCAVTHRADAIVNRPASPDQPFFHLCSEGPAEG